MAVKQVYKRIKVGVKPVVRYAPPTVVEEAKKPANKKATNKKNKEEKENEDMITTEQFDRVDALVQDINVPQQVKVVKKDRGLIERTESSKIVLTEDNRQVLND